MLKDYQEKEAGANRAVDNQENIQVNVEVEKRIKLVEIENEKYKHEYSKLAQLRAAYNADKKAFAEKVEDLEARLRHTE